jgi:pimeloyl-ACP methyl ester carboxylesterase
MAEPRIQYARTSDGVSIAFSTLGEGMPLVWLAPFLWSHLGMEWKNPVTRRARESLAQKRLVIRFDGRGSGLSDRGVSNLTLSDLVLDLEAVVDHLNVERFALMSILYSGPVAIRYAVQHPERVSHLIVVDPWDGRPDVPFSPQYEATRSLAGKDWELFSENRPVGSPSSFGSPSHPKPTRHTTMPGRIST